MQNILFSKDIDKIIDNLDLERLGKNVAIKVHFGEKGCVTYMNPEYVKKVYEAIIATGRKAALVECNVLYKGSRTNAEDHVRTAKEHGFDFAPIDILDGKMGDEKVELPVNGKYIKNAKIGKGIEKYDSMVVIAHFKGHGLAGFGGCIKSVGMGLGSRAGKMEMHCNIKPSINPDICIGCGTCIEHCEQKAISLIDCKSVIDPDKCIGCAMCISVCEQKAVNVPFDSATEEELQRRIVEYSKAVIEKIGAEKMIYINILEKITDTCDCHGVILKPVMKDVGIAAGYNIVAADKAALDIAIKESKGKFDKINKVDKYEQMRYASEEMGMGEKEYEIKQL